MLEDIRAGWGWLGIAPAATVDVNKFGNVIFRTVEGAYWRICPEELACERIAGSDGEFATLRDDADFREDWEMARLVAAAEAKHGVQPPGRCFCLKIPAVFGGEYAIANVGTISVAELIRFAGSVAERTKDLPDGAQVSFRFVE